MGRTGKGQNGGETVIEIQCMKEEYIVYTTFGKRKLINAELENAIWIEMRIKKKRSQQNMSISKHLYLRK